VISFNGIVIVIDYICDVIAPCLAWTSSSRSLYSSPGRLSNLGFATSSLPACTNSKLRRALIVAIPKPEKPPGDPKSYRLISLLCVSFKILERLIYARVESIIDPLLPQEQAGLRHGRSAVDQVTLLTQDIEDSFSAKRKSGAVFDDLTADYDAVWHRGLTCKLPPETANRAGYNASRTASHKDLSWRPFSSTSTSLTCQQPFLESMHILTTWQSRMLMEIGRQWKGCWARTWQPQVNTSRLGS